MTGMSPDDIVANFRQGDGGALKQLLRLYRKEIRYFVWRILKDGHTADEIVNDAFLKTWNARTNFKSLPEIRAYLYTVSRNDCLNFLKSPRSRRLDNIDDVGHLLHSEERIEAQMIYSELLNLVYERVNKLPEKQRRVFQLSFFEGLSTEEIAAQLGISPNAVFINKSIALKTIRRAFGGDIVLLCALFLLAQHVLGGTEVLTS